MIQIAMWRVLEAILLAVSILVILGLVGLSAAGGIDYWEKLKRSRLTPYLIVGFLVIVLFTACYLFLTGFYNTLDFVLLGGYTLIILLFFDWSKLKRNAKKEEGGEDDPHSI